MEIDKGNSAVLSSLRLSDFRGYETLRIKLGVRLTVLTGGNAQGKTNFLRSVQTLGLGDAREAGAEQVRFGRDVGVIEGDVLCGGAEERLLVSITRSGAARLSINGKAASRPRWVGRLPVLFVGPGDRDRVMGPPAARRAVLDELLEQIDPAYLAARRGYQRALRQRNRALTAPRFDTETVAIWEDALAKHGAVLAAGRMSALSALGPQVNAWHRELGEGADKGLALNYLSGASRRESSGGDPDSGSISAWERLLRARFAEMRERERAAGTTLVGPHRDEVQVQLAGHALRETGSSGEIWTAILAQVLASAEYLGEKLGRFPLLLLDDVMATLDRKRSERLLAVLSRYDPQSVITTTDEVAEGYAKETFTVADHALARLDGPGLKERTWQPKSRVLYARS